MTQQRTRAAPVDDGQRLAERLLQERRESACEPVVVAAGIEGDDDVYGPVRKAVLSAQDRRHAESGHGDAACGCLQHVST